ncbi:serine/threonine-protein kinase [Streptomyces sp. NPDC002205]|uniref:serine/threonine-protein kinase n=1 Tax=Streptomyces sp. NPDC002205 TaxID=3154411 RepID=UPI0033183A73
MDPRALGPFELLALLGQGGMGRAYLARQLPLDRLGPEWEHAYHLAGPTDEVERGLVVVKVIRPQSLSDGTPGEEHQARARFGQEVDAVRAVVSGRVPALIAADAHADQPWLAMDYVHGPTLGDLVRKAGPLTLGPYAALGLAMVDALRAIHGANLLHRDLKPGNVALGPTGPMVLDFGLAVLAERNSSQALTQTGWRMGTTSYYPLEQHYDTKHVGTPADVYGLGATLFFAATGRPPYPNGPMPAPPHWEDMDAAFIPLLAQILVQIPEQRPLLDAVEQNLRFLLAEHGLTDTAAAEQLRAAVEASALIADLSPYVGDPEVREAAQAAVDDGAAPDSPWNDGVELFEEFFRPQEPQVPVEPEDQHTSVAPALTIELRPTDLDPRTLVDQQERRLAKNTATSYPLAPPLPPLEPPAPAEAPPAARKAAERLRKAYAHSGRL